MPVAQHIHLLTIRPRRGGPTDVIAASEYCVAHDLWPIAEDPGSRLKAGDPVLLCASAIGLVGDAVIDGPWRPWHPNEREGGGSVPELLRARADDGPLGIVPLLGARGWHTQIRLVEAGLLGRRIERRPTHDIESLDEGEWRDAHKRRALAGRPWRPPGREGPWDDPDLGWLVVEELFDATAQIELSRWPRAGIDHHTPPAFHSDPLTLTADRATLERIWSDATPDTVQVETDERPGLHAGAVLAVICDWDLAPDATLDREHLDELADLEAIADGHAHVVTNEARELAQSAFYAAVTGEAGPDDPALPPR